MKNVEAIQARVRFLLVEELNARVQLASRRLPHLCVHNYRHAMDVRKKVNDEANENYNRISLPVAQSIGLCMLGSDSPDDWQGTICEDPIDAQRCPYFNPRIDKKRLWDEFEHQLRDPEWLRTNMPEVYGLLWALDMQAPPPIPWWKQLWYKMLRIKIEPLQPPEDVSKLLPPAGP